MFKYLSSDQTLVAGCGIQISTTAHLLVDNGIDTAF